MRIPAALCLFVLMCSAGAYAQAIAGFGAITGKVRDIYGDGIPDTTVTITNRALGLRLVLTTTDDGVFYAPALAPAAGYAVKVTRKGFLGWDASSLRVPVGETVNFHITLQQTAPGVKPQTGKAPGVQDTKSGITDLISRDAIADLPLSARRVESLVAEAPLAALGGKPDTIGFRGSPSSDVAVVDGLDASDGYFLNKADPLRAFPAEAVDSVQVIASTPPMEYKATGGIANAATRTGTEDFHGEVYAFYRNGSFASPDRYDPSFRPPDKQETEGANVGGQAMDRLYFFVSGEASSGSAQAINRITNPLIADANSIAGVALALRRAGDIGAMHGGRQVRPIADERDRGALPKDLHRSGACRLPLDRSQQLQPGGGRAALPRAQWSAATVRSRQMAACWATTAMWARRRATRMPAGRRNWDRMWSTNCASGGIKTASRCCPKPSSGLRPGGWG